MSLGRLRNWLVHPELAAAPTSSKDELVIVNDHGVRPRRLAEPQMAGVFSKSPS